jgi:hypothetical protein
MAPSPDAERATVTAARAIHAARATKDEASAAVAADRAYDAAVEASLLLLQEYGHRRAGALTRGVTLDRRPSRADLQRAVDLTGPGGWVRFVLDPAVPLRSYALPLETAHQLGLKVLLQPVDSSAMSAFDDAGWRRRWEAAVGALPGADEWETGNEINGDWLGDDVAERVAWATRYVHAQTTAPALVTLYWQLGEGEPENALFNWVADHPEAVAGADVIGLSIYPEEHPLGAATDRVLRQLNRVLPDRPIVISELDYWAADLDHTWWWGSKADPHGTGRTRVAGFYTQAIGSFPFGAGGPFWWYFLDEVRVNSPLAAALRESWS